jgi:hypothetical protein
MQDEMSDLMEQSNEIQESLGRSYDVGEIDEGELEDGEVSVNIGSYLVRIGGSF